ncbi:PepSY domain-containing protein [Pacificimonas sp. WHA3]|uniref:PepSY domain-containing protein n=1 Tax=Pacificimonas pallii TaxID=2827236 RepID=A0ABS6SIE1_9SPHN|nr:PepSY-associated TM helix domain-containing protein [Pacificimonas pallii]MBV7257823.1 PepSY domain-containing protein [Pacificimonas pallii]
MEMARATGSGGQVRVKPAPKAARLWWRVHQWAGLKLSLFMTFILFTGTLAVVSAEIDWVLQPSLRVLPSSVAGPVAWAEIAANAAEYPGVARATAIEAPTASAFAAKVTVKDPAGDIFFLHAHPTTGKIQGTGPWMGAQRVLRNMHRHLNLPVWIGVPIVTSLAFLLFITLTTSFVVYKKWWRGFAKPLRRRDARTWWGDFHRLAGIWSLWFVALIALTSMWYFVESLGGEAQSHPHVEPEGLTAAGAPPADLTKAFAAALAANRELRAKRAILPSIDNPMLQLHGDAKAVLVRPRANAVWVDARSGEVMLTTDGRALSLHQRISEMADPLHFGYFGDYWTKVPWFLFGLAMTGLSLSGAAIYSLRIARERGDRIELGRSFAGMWTGMGHWRWLSACLVLTAFVFLTFLILGIP